MSGEPTKEEKIPPASRDAVFQLDGGFFFIDPAETASRRAAADAFFEKLRMSDEELKSDHKKI